MNKLEMLQTATNYLISRGITLDDFYTLTIRATEITLQGRYNRNVAKRLNNAKVTDQGYIESVIGLHGVDIVIVLTE